MSGGRSMVFARRIAEIFAKELGALLFASPCLICEGEDGPICSGCRDELIEANVAQCPRCALSVGPYSDIREGCSECRGRRLGFDSAYALGPYQGPIRALCLKLKSTSGAWIARHLIDVLWDARGEKLRAEGAGVVVAVPLHWRRHLRRGYNQSEVLAEALAKRLGLRVIAPLRRVASTPKLYDRGREERASLMRGAFLARRGADVKGRTVILVDDILTTGATCGAAARALKAAGASRVVAVVVARAEGRA